MKRTPPSNARRSRTLVKTMIKRALRARFPQDTVDVSDGYEGNIRVVVVSRIFDKMDLDARQEFLWAIIDRIGLSDDERALISFVFPVSVALLS